MPEVKKEELRAPNFFRNIFVWELIIFSLIFILGILSSSFLLRNLEIEKFYLPDFSFSDFLKEFILVTAFILFVSFSPLAKKKRGLIYKFIFSITLWLTGSLLLSIWLLDFLALLIMGVILFWRLKYPNVFNHNFCMILGLAGVGVIFGLSLAPEIIVFLLVIFSIYDFIAVYKTKHMQKIAVEMTKYNAILALIIPKEINDLKCSLNKKEARKKLFILGGGDVVFPLLLSVSLVKASLFSSLLVAVFSLFGLFFSFWIFRKKGFREAMPALPPIALFSIIGYLFTLFLGF